MTIILAAVLAACGTPAPPPSSAPAPAPVQAAAVREIDVGTLRQALTGGAFVVDVRTPGEFANGHVPGALNVPLDELEARVGELGPKDRELYVICESGGRSARASDILATRGFRPVNVAGGTRAWREAGLPVE